MAMQVKLTSGDSARLFEGQTKSLRAWEKLTQARDLFLRFNPIDNHNAALAAKEALHIDPHYTSAMVLIGMCSWIDARFNPAADKEQCLKLAEQQVEMALGINPEMNSAHMLRGGIAFLRGNYDEAIELCRKSVDLAPSDAHTTAFIGLVHIHAGGRPERADGTANSDAAQSTLPRLVHLQLRACQSLGGRPGNGR
jgi:adenylate cyclase